MPVAKERTEHVAKLVRVSNFRTIARELFTFADSELTQLNLEGGGQLESDSSRQEHRILLCVAGLPPAQLRLASLCRPLKKRDVAPRRGCDSIYSAQIPDEVLVIRRDVRLTVRCGMPQCEDFTRPCAAGAYDRDRLTAHVDDTVTGADILDVLVQGVGHEDARARREAARPDPCLNGVHARGDQCLGCRGGGHIASGDLRATTEVARQPGDGLDHRARVAV